MAAVFEETLMALGDWAVDVDFKPTTKDLMVDADGNTRNLELLLWDTSVSPEALVYPPMVLKRWSGDETGLTFGGLGALWHLGFGEIGPTVPEGREYLSGATMLSNGTFDLGDRFWRRPSEDSRWVINGGRATNLGGLGTDDVLEFDRLFPLRPGNEYQAIALNVSGAGRLRVRIIMKGRFNPPNILGDPVFAGAGWSLTPGVVTVEPGLGSGGGAALTFGPIPKPKPIDVDFSSSAGWALGPTMSVSGGALVCSPNPQPVLNSDPGFETGTGYTDSIGPPSAPMSDDIDLVNLPAEAHSGGWVMRVGPNTQHQVFANADLSASSTTFPNWYDSSSSADPDFVFYIDPVGGLNGAHAAVTDGVATSTPPGTARAIKYLRTDASTGVGGVQAYDVRPGERYLYEQYIRAAPGTDGTAYASLNLPHPTVPALSTWLKSNVLEGVKVSDDIFNRVAIPEFTIPANRTKIYGLFEVHNHLTGYWALGLAILTRTRGNRAEIQSDATYPITANTRHVVSALMRTGELGVGNVRFGVILTGAGMEPRRVDIGGSTDYAWTYVPQDVTPTAGYTDARLFVTGLDLSESAWIDNLTLTQVEGNTDVSTFTPVPVVSGHRYLLEADVEMLGATRGTVTVGLTLSGPTVTDHDVPISFGVADGGGIKADMTDVIPGPDYDTATLYVRSTDVESGPFKVHKVTLTKMDNNTVTSTGPAVGVTPERTYRWTEYVRSGTGLQRGTVKLEVECPRSGHDAIVFDSIPMEATEGERKQIVFEFSTPSGYDEIVPKIINTDGEGDSWYVGGGELRDTDTGSVVFDSVTIDPVNVSPFVNAIAPEGAESVGVAVIAEEGTGPWSVGGVSLVRSVDVPATGADVAGDLLVDPETGNPLSIVAGTIDASTPIPYDWSPVDLTHLAAMVHLCDVVADPPLEFQLTPTIPAALDLGPSADVFTDHAPDSATPVVFLPGDLDVVALPRVESNVEARPTHIKLLGAELQTVTGKPFLITATAQVPGPVQLGANNLPITRTKRVNLPTVDHIGYAQARADDLARQEAEPPFSLTVVVNEFDEETADTLGEDHRPPYKVGDWVYGFKPEAGLIGPAASATNIEGETVFPRRLRVLSRKRELADIGTEGSRYRIEMRRPDGTTFDLPGVNPSVANVTTLTVGDRFLQWEADPQGLSEIEQWSADRAFRGRASA